MNPAPPPYLRDPAAITRRSFEIIRREADLSALPPDALPLALRMIHACGMTDIVSDLAITPDAPRAGRRALDAGAPVLCDAFMVAAGITRGRLPAGNAVDCLIGDDGVAREAKACGVTRAMVAVEHWRDRLGGAVVAIGNAPTALFRLIEGIQAGWPKPALIVATPVGFVGAAESKDALIEAGLGVPYVALKGRRGGSALAAAAINALARDEACPRPRSGDSA
ncbi:MAG: precorrin-8X methylmutase [Alphaproteobacteria bacterium]